MAQVYKARDNVLGRIVAVKVLREQYATDEQFVSRFRREAQAAGLGPGDNPVFPDMHEATAWVAGATLAAARAVAGGRVAHAFNPAGGLHHATRGRASGFCI